MKEPDAPRELQETAVEYKSQKARLTYEDYCLTPPGERYELIEGVLRKMTPAPSVFHQEISKRLERLLLEWVEDRGLGKVYDAPIDVVLSQHNVLQPDLIYISKERTEIIHKANIWGAPDLVVEILSPSTAELDQETKRQIYAAYGVRELWLVDPDNKSIEVATLDGHELATLEIYRPGSIMTTRLLPGFSLDVGMLFKL